MSLSHQVTGDVPGRSAPRSATAATGPFLVERCILLSRMTVGTALSNAKCTSRRWGGARPGRWLARGAPPGGLRRRGLSKSATKAPIGPRRARRIVDIPGFSSRPIPARGAFVADLDTPPPRTAPGVPPAPPHVRPPLSPRRLGPTDPDPQTAVPGKKGSMRAQLDKIHLSSHDVSSARQNPPELDSCELSSHNAS